MAKRKRINQENGNPGSGHALSMREPRPLVICQTNSVSNSSSPLAVCFLDTLAVKLNFFIFGYFYMYWLGNILNGDIFQGFDWVSPKF